MADVTENPPLASYYAALVGSVAGWSERALHLAFLVPALAVVLGTYRLALKVTRFPLLAALATLLTPGVLVSATSVMCDTMMVAFWVWAVVLWAEGLDPFKPSYLLAAGVLITASALTKYYGAALIPLLAAYSLVRLRRSGWWMFFFLIPVLTLGAYEIWTAHLYGHGLMGAAATFAATQRETQQGSTIARTLVSLSFAGGCAASALALSPIVWPWKRLLAGILPSVFAAFALIFESVPFGMRVGGEYAAHSLKVHWMLTSMQLTLCILSALAMVALAIAEVWGHWRDATSWLLALWVLGTLYFAGFVNWTVNARSVLPLIPAVGLLVFRRLERVPQVLPPRASFFGAVAGLTIAGVIGLLVTISDFTWANSAREAAHLVYKKTRAERGRVYFVGHWGFQYYMQALGFTPGDELQYKLSPGDIIVVPMNNTELARTPRGIVLSRQEELELLKHNIAATMSVDLGAGFYSSMWGPLPFSFGPVPPERYELLRVSRDNGASAAK